MGEDEGVDVVAGVALGVFRGSKRPEDLPLLLSELRASWQLVREALDLSGAVRGEPRPLARGVPLRELDEKGFSVEKDGSLFTISISMRRTFRDGSELRRVFSTAVKALPGLLGN